MSNNKETRARTVGTNLNSGGSLGNIKLEFMDWFFYNLVILVKQSKISCNNLDKALLLSRNHLFCLKNWQVWWAPTTTDFNNFSWNFAHVSYLPMPTKGCSGLFILFRTWVICTVTETRFINNSRSKQNKKNPEHPFIDIGKK